ncbi:MAG: outer membrane protein assembly factor BamE, partial [Pseudomonadota bacterium]
MIRLFFLICIVSTLALSGCGLIYEQNIQQGNVLEADDVGQLEQGMSKRQVLALLGSPAVENPFHADRWDYVNSYAERGRNPVLRRLTVEFDNDQVARFYGNYLDELDLSERND